MNSKNRVCPNVQHPGRWNRTANGLWDADKIYGRYRYYKKGHVGGVGKPHKMSDDEIVNQAEIILENRQIEKSIAELSKRFTAVEMIDNYLMLDCKDTCDDAVDCRKRWLVKTDYKIFRSVILVEMVYSHLSNNSQALNPQN